MAEINTSSTSDSHGKVRSKKISTRIDMTPMVDLAFLLLTFFVMTTVLTKPFAMRLDMPEETKEEPPPINARHVMTLVLKEDGKIYWNIGSAPEMKLTDYSNHGIRPILVENNAMIKNLFVMIKPSNKSKYKNLIDILDEMTITGIKRYAVVDVTPEDELLVKKAPTILPR